MAQNGDLVTIGLPFTIEFDIARNTWSSASTATIRVLNLSEKTRLKLLKNQIDPDTTRSIVLQAGYGDNLSTILKGNIYACFSVREGVNMVTTFQCYDGGSAYANAFTNSQYVAGTPQRSVISDMVGQLKQQGIQIGAIGQYPGEISRGNSYSGPTTSVLQELTGGGFFIDNGVAHCLNDNECISGEPYIINNASGLLGTPIQEQFYYKFSMIFEPKLKLGQLVQVETSTGVFSFAGFNLENARATTKKLEGVVKSIHHKGTISDAICGDAVTELGIIPGTYSPVTQAVQSAVSGG